MRISDSLTHSPAVAIITKSEYSINQVLTELGIEPRNLSIRSRTPCHWATRPLIFEIFMPNFLYQAFRYNSSILNVHTPRRKEVSVISLFGELGPRWGMLRIEGPTEQCDNGNLPSTFPIQYYVRFKLESFQF